MAIIIKRANYYYTTIKDRPGEAYGILASLSDQGIHLLSFQAIPMGPEITQLALFPSDELEFIHIAKKIGMTLEGPHAAIIVQGDDEIGVLATIHEKLYRAKVNIYAANGVTSQEKGFGYVIYIRSDEFSAACDALDI